MTVYTTDKIRNVVLLGHGGCGKTSLAEAMAYLAGMTTRMGKVTDGNTISDYDKEEIKRHFSINTTVIPIVWGDTKINILDTPGYFDFVGEVEEAVSAADAAIIVVSGKAGIEVGTKKAWELCETYKLPRMVFVTDMDIDEASYRQVVEDLQQHDVEQHQACDADDELPVDFGFALFHRLSLISALSCRSPAGLPAGGRSPACTSAGAATARSRPGSRAPCA